MCFISDMESCLPYRSLLLFGQLTVRQYVLNLHPRPYHTLVIYNSDCSIASVQRKVSAAAGSNVPTTFNMGRGGDVSSVHTGVQSIDQIVIDYGRGGMIPCR